MLSERELLDSGVSKYGVVKTEEFVFGEEIRKICDGNGCGSFAKSWVCPPAIGTYEETKERVLSYENALVFQTIYPLEDSFDFEGMDRARIDFRTVCDNINELAKTKGVQYLILSNGGCSRCERCTYPDSPCVHPDKLYPALEGSGVYVNKLAQSAGLKYINGINTVTYFGVVLY